LKASVTVGKQAGKWLTQISMRRRNAFGALQAVEAQECPPRTATHCHE
jgi:hypothetical protein